jgi:hypothetical protein
MAADSTSSRSVKIDSDERGGWSSDRPRRDGAPPPPAALGVRGRTLRPAELLRYAPGSLLVIVSGSPQARDALVERTVDERGAPLSLDKVHALLAARGAHDSERAQELLDAAVAKRLAAGETVVLTAQGVGPEERERYVRMAAAHRRPCHLILVEAGRGDVAEGDRPTLNELRRALDAGELGAEGFTTFLRLGGSSIGEVKRIVFRPASGED